MWHFSYFLNFLKMVILELRYSGTEPTIFKRFHFFGNKEFKKKSVFAHLSLKYSLLQRFVNAST